MIQSNKTTASLLSRYSAYKNSILKKVSVAAAMVAISVSANAQANYWNLGGAYMDCNTGSATTLSGTPYTQYLFESDAASFLIPGLCNTYCKLGFGLPGRANTIVINHITESYVPSIPGFTSGMKQISTSTFYSDDASYTPGQLRSDGTRVIYARNGNAIMNMGTLSPTGVVSGTPTVLYSYPVPSGVKFDRWTEMEVSSDGKYLLLVGADAKDIGIFNLQFNTLITYPAPGGGYSRIQGFEYVKSWGGTVRIYVSYNSKCAANPGGTGGIGYYDMSGAFTPVTAYPATTTPTEFGFSELELAKDNKLYMAHNAGGNYNFSNPGTVYSLASTGVWTATTFTVPAANNMAYAAECNKYYIQTQIDGENYNYGTYAGPSAAYFLARLNGQGTFSAFPNPSTPTTYRCGSEPIILTFQAEGLMDRYDVKVTSGTLVTSGSTTVFTPSPGLSVTTTQYTYNNSASLSLLTFVPDSYIGSDWKIEITPKNNCAIGPTTNIYSKVRSATATVDFMIRSPYCTTTSGKQTRTTTVAGLASPGTVSTPVCSQGNLGASTAGFFPPTLSTTSAPTNFSVRVEEVDASGAPLSVPNVIVNYINSALPVASYYGMADYSLTPTNAGYFISNYPTVKGSKIFKLTVGITTPECGLTSAYSYFKIMDDGLTGPYTTGAFWKTAEDDALVQAKVVEVNIMPNPATNNVKISWFVSENNDQKTKFSLVDVLGKEVLHQQWAEGKGSNEQNITIEQLSSGIYYYKLETGGTVKSGKLIKE